MNEGHAAFAVLERARSLAARMGISFREALWATRAGNLFTTHTPVDAGFDRFPLELLEPYRPSLTRVGIDPDIVLALGREDGTDDAAPFNMAYLAARGSLTTFGVSRRHGAVSRRIFQSLYPRWPEHEVPIGHVTNGVHVPTWDSQPPMRSGPRHAARTVGAAFRKTCAAKWRGCRTICCGRCDAMRGMSSSRAYVLTCGDIFHRAAVRQKSSHWWTAC